MAIKDKGKEIRKYLRSELENILEDVSGAQASKIEKLIETIMFSCKKIDERKLESQYGEITELIYMLREQVAKNIPDNIDLICDRIAGILKQIF